MGDDDKICALSIVVPRGDLVGLDLNRGLYRLFREGKPGMRSTPGSIEDPDFIEGGCLGFYRAFPHCRLGGIRHISHSNERTAEPFEGVHSSHRYGAQKGLFFCSIGMPV